MRASAFLASVWLGDYSFAHSGEDAELPSPSSGRTSIPSELPDVRNLKRWSLPDSVKTLRNSALARNSRAGVSPPLSVEKAVILCGVHAAPRGPEPSMI